MSSITRFTDILRSVTSLTDSLHAYLESHSEVSEDEMKVAQTALRELAQCPSQPEEEASRALTGIVDRIWQSTDRGLCEVVRNVFERTIQRQPSEQAPRQSDTERTRFEMSDSWQGIEVQNQDFLTQIIGFLDPLSKRRSAQVCKRWHAAAHQQLLFDLSPLYHPEFQRLLSLFRITLPSAARTPKEVSVVYKALYATVQTTLKCIRRTKAMSDEEKIPYDTVTPQEIVHEPARLHEVLQIANDLSLVSPFLGYVHAGPDQPSSTTLSEKASIIKKHLEERGDCYTQLNCYNAGMLCLPREFCALQNLYTLNLYQNLLTAVPAEIRQLKKLEHFNLSQNLLTALPAEIEQLDQITTLDLSYNLLTTLPTEIGRLINMTSLCLNNNPLATLPVEIGQLPSLMYLQLDQDQKASLPTPLWLFTQPISFTVFWAQQLQTNF